MTDEAVVRIVLEGEKAKSPTPEQPPRTSTPERDPSYFVKQIGKEFGVFKPDMRPGRATMSEGIDVLPTRELAQKMTDELNAQMKGIAKEIAPPKPELIEDAHEKRRQYNEGRRRKRADVAADTSSTEAPDKLKDILEPLPKAESPTKPVVPYGAAQLGGIEKQPSLGDFLKPIISTSITPPQSSSEPPKGEDDLTHLMKEQRDWINDLIKGIEGSNRHVLLEGQSGSGKSLLAKHIAFQRMEQGEDVHVVDPHTPEAWGGAKQVFQGQNAGVEAAKFMYDELAKRKQSASEAKLQGGTPDFRPMTIVLSDFARLMRDTPQLRDEFRTLLTEARKFRISIVADTTALNVASSGLKGILDIRQNFAQQAKLFAPTPDNPERTAKIGGEEFTVPKLPSYEERKDYSLVKSTENTELDVPVGAAAAAKRKFELEKYKKEVDAEYQKLIRKEADDLAAKQKEPVDTLIPKPRVELSSFEEAARKGHGQNLPEAADEERTTGPKKRSWLDTAQSMRGMIGGVGGPLVGGGLDVLANSASAASGAISSIVPVVGAVTLAFKTFEAAVDAIDQRVERLAEYSPEISQAQAEREVIRVLNDIRRAQENSAQLAEYIQAQTEMQERWEELKMNILMKVAPIITGIFNVLNWILGSVTEINDRNDVNDIDPTNLILRGPNIPSTGEAAPLIQAPLV